MTINYQPPANLPANQELITCKRCGSSAIVRYGTYGQRQVYMCKSCRMKFKADQCSFHMKTPFTEISRFLTLLYCGTAIEEIDRLLEAEFGRSPSKRTLFKWLNKYSRSAISRNQYRRPLIKGETWIADETVIRIHGQKVWIFDIQDEKTRFLLASHITPSRSETETGTFFQQACHVAGTLPARVITDSYISYLIETESEPADDGWKVPLNLFVLETDPQRIVPFHATLRDRTTVVKRLKSIASARLFNQSWLVYYNFFRAHEALNGKTPAEQAGIESPCKCWEDVIRNA
ncbi:MAG: DDE-type integrase/transposase/recombinase [Dehalococcoidales bacterium]|nr:DDE-type integrase/transposase/recombinase [Dehalococcoidales bacterium]